MKRAIPVEILEKWLDENNFDGIDSDTLLTEVEAGRLPTVPILEKLDEEEVLRIFGSPYNILYGIFLHGICDWLPSSVKKICERFGNK